MPRAAQSCSKVAPHQEPRHCRQRHHQQMRRRRIPRQPGNVAQPGTRPQTLDRHAGRLHRGRGERNVPERAGAKHFGEAAQLTTERLHARIRRVLGDNPRNQDGSDDGETREAHENDAPVGHFQGELDWNGGGDHADAAGEEHPAVHRRQACRRKPQNVGLDPGHQAPGHAEPDEGARQRQGRHAAGHGEQQAAAGCYQQQGGVGAARAEAVEQQAERKLERREGQKVRAGEQPQLRWRQIELRHQVGGDDSVDAAVQV